MSAQNRNCSNTSDAADAVTAEYAAAMEEAIAAAAKAENERDAALAHKARIEAALSAVTSATENMHEKALDLYWLGRRNIEEARHGPSGPAIERILADHAEEAQKIANGDVFEHGYWAGTLTFLRLIEGLAISEDDRDDEDNVISAASIRASALAEYPCLDS